MKAVLICLVLVGFAFANKEHHQALLRERLSKAKTMKEALEILRNADPNAPMSMVTPDSLEKEHQQVVKITQQLNRNSYEILEPRNGGCEPRVICKTVPIDRATTNNVMSFPQCLEIHECGGCCQEPQFSCIPVQQEPVRFGPMLMVSLNELGRYEVPESLTLMNHTKCECRCNTTSEQCRQNGEVLDTKLCKCFKPKCSPPCPTAATCSIIDGTTTARCTCRRPLSGQGPNINYCQNSNEVPDSMCRRCVPAIQNRRYFWNRV